jgi:hypothetical protein
MLGRACRCPAGLVACVALVLLGGCGGSDDGGGRDRATDRADALSGALRNLVTDRDLRNAPPGSAQRALLSWFQATQFEDVRGVRLLVARAELERVGDARLKAAIAIVGPALGKPSIVSVRRAGSSTSIRTIIRAFQSGRSEAASAELQSFEMVRPGGSWQLADLNYLLEAAHDIRRAQATAR